MMMFFPALPCKSCWREPPSEGATFTGLLAGGGVADGELMLDTGTGCCGNWKLDGLIVLDMTGCCSVVVDSVLSICAF